MCLYKYYLNSQAEVDALGATGCDRIEGDLVILQSSGITNLDGIANITSVEGGVEIVNSALTNIDGLDSLTSLSGDIFFTYNSALCQSLVDALSDTLEGLGWTGATSLSDNADC